MRECGVNPPADGVKALAEGWRQGLWHFRRTSQDASLPPWDSLVVVM